VTLETDQQHGESARGRLAPVPSVESLEHELKFVLPLTAAPVLRVWLGGVCRPDPEFPSGIVSSIYYDTRDWRLLAEKINSDYLKTKIRVRWYSRPGRPDLGGPAFLEAKFRIGGRREKIRLALAETGTELLARGFDDPFLAALPRRLRDRGVTVDEGLVPAMLIRYERLRWFEPGAGARVSLDTNISSPMASAAMGLQVRGPLHVAVVEAKGHFDRLPPTLETITALGGRRASFSKYWACYQHGRRIAQ
jgi:hypothetical protein